MQTYTDTGFFLQSELFTKNSFVIDLSLQYAIDMSLISKLMASEKNQVHGCKEKCFYEFEDLL